MIKLALLKVWLESAWHSFIVFCKERWELLAGALIGILSVLALRNKNQERVLEKSIESSRDIRDQNIKISEDTAGKISEALGAHAEREDQIERDHREKSESLDSREKDLKDQILEREKSDPGAIAKEINKLID